MTFSFPESRTPIDHPEKSHIIAHLNDEHSDEITAFARVLGGIKRAELDKNIANQSNQDEQIKLVDIYAEGFEVGIANSAPLFIAFPQSITSFDDLQTQYILLKQKADKALGKKSIKLTSQHFTVLSSEHISPNMLRLTLDLDLNPEHPMPTDEAGYAYLFDLKINDSPTFDTSKSRKEERKHVYYTLRKAWQADDVTQAWVDIYVHGDTPAGNWATALQAKDRIQTTREFPEKVAHLSDGQAVLICDETSVPTVARLLELWTNPTPPMIVFMTQHADDQAYLTHHTLDIAPDLSNNLTVLPLNIDPITIDTDTSELATVIINRLDEYLRQTSMQIDKVWGAVEADTAKALRPLLRKRFELDKSDVVLKVYWRKS